MAVVATTLIGTASAGAAYTPAQRDEQKRYAEETVRLTYTEFIQRKTDFTAARCRIDTDGYVHRGQPSPNCTKPAPYDAFNWTDDGCSGRDEFEIAGRIISNIYRDLFNEPCQQHDFGYRNFGDGLQLDRTEDRRARIDSEFLSEMRRVCNAWGVGLVRIRECHVIAMGVYAVVRNGSDWSTPGPATDPVDAPAPAPAPALPVYTVMNTSETPPDGVWFRNSPHTRDTSRISGLGVYANDQVRLRCFAWGDAVGGYANRLWYLADNVSRPAAGDRANSGYLSAHYVNDGLRANEVAAAVPAC